MRSTPQKGKPTGAGTTAGSTKKHTHALIVGQVDDGLTLTTTHWRTIVTESGDKHRVGLYAMAGGAKSTGLPG